MSSSPALPALYELVTHRRLDSALGEARRLAAAGAEEGTLVWAEEQTAARGRSGQDWVSPSGNLYAALILRPDYPVRTAFELNYVAAVSLGAALGGLLSPMVGLRYRWPNDVLINDAKAATVRLESPIGDDETPPWLILDLSVNVENSPAETTFPATSLRAAEGAIAFTAGDVLGSFARHFLSWINRWADEGAGPVLRHWRQRAEGLGAPMMLKLAGETLRSTLVEVDDHGNAVFTSGEETRLITLSQFYSGPAVPVGPSPPDQS